MHKLLALLFPLLLALLLTGFIPVADQEIVIDERLQLQRLKVDSASELEQVFLGLGHWRC